MINIYDFKEYKSYLLKVLGEAGTRTGKRLKLANFLGVQTAFISNVLSGLTNFSAEHAFEINKFLEHTKEEGDYFLLLVQKERAGSKDLENYYKEKILEISDKRKIIKNRVDTNKVVSEKDHNKYYSNWMYTAIHMALSVPELQDFDKMCEYFKIPRQQAMKVVGFLVQAGLALQEKGKYKIGPSHIHIGNDVDNVSKHHMNWRLQAMKSLEREKKTDLHYSVIYSLSKVDAEKIQEKIIQMIRENLQTVAPSKEEVIYCNTIDFFELKEE